MPDSEYEHVKNSSETYSGTTVRASIFDPRHDSLYSKFEQLEVALDDLRRDIPADVQWRAEAIRKLVRLVRAQVLK